MIDGYRVSMEKLTRLVNDLDRAADEIAAANNALANAKGRDLGTPGIDSAAEDFQERWSHGIEKLGEGAEVTSKALDAARAAYAQLENEVSNLIASTVGGEQQPPGSSGTSSGEGPSAIEQRLGGL
ncbi:hypothetical protein [Saccharopolyspora rectivirgula]|uniref:PE domain-containing protein n=1 Tax=Saccharopolyspora rectivirgula TaxID=28042 RepID=A0A073AVC9_9PSEU|nr:hypothetical protein [Saccharopolyspora rectivirgula]KEI43350.1 hypothetical protein GU90_16465 [Saccharopolyspora rectivirgula]